VNFDPSPEELALVEAARALLDARWSADEARRALDRPPAYVDDDLWGLLADLGWFGIAAGVDVGGAGGDLVTSALLAEAAGHALLPGAATSTVAAALCLDRWTDHPARAALAPRLAGGDLRAALAVDEPGRTGLDDCARLTTVATPDGDGWRLAGAKTLVLDADGADLLLVAARHGTDLVVAAVDRGAAGVEVVPAGRLDGRSLANVGLAGVLVPGDRVLSAPDTLAHPLRWAYEALTALTAAELVGVAAWLLETTTAYAGDRVQFGRPIGTFQAVSHRLADTLVDVELGRGLAHGACLALATGTSGATDLVSAAKAWTGDAAVRAAETALQLHGGIGYTWELDVHLYLRRARADAVAFGTPDQHRRRIAARYAATAPSEPDPVAAPVPDGGGAV
jgi:alkylation response protein AidB-like acyl-CoA dehydrogenase